MFHDQRASNGETFRSPMAVSGEADAGAGVTAAGGAAATLWCVLVGAGRQLPGQDPREHERTVVRSPDHCIRVHTPNHVQILRTARAAGRGRRRSLPDTIPRAPCRALPCRPGSRHPHSATATRAKKTRESPCKAAFRTDDHDVAVENARGKAVELDRRRRSDPQQAGIGVVDGYVHDRPRGVDDFGEHIAKLQPSAHHVFHMRGRAPSRRWASASGWHPTPAGYARLPTSRSRLVPAAGPPGYHRYWQARGSSGAAPPGTLPGLRPASRGRPSRPSRQAPGHASPSRLRARRPC